MCYIKYITPLGDACRIQYRPSCILLVGNDVRPLLPRSATWSYAVPMPNQLSEVLCLRGAPGMSAELESQKFGSTLPIHWLGQPKGQPDAERQFEIPVDAACADILHLSAEREGRLDPLANAFGAPLARALIDRILGKMCAIAICGGVWERCTTVVRLGPRIARVSGFFLHCLHAHRQCRVCSTVAGVHWPLIRRRPRRLLRPKGD